MQYGGIYLDTKRLDEIAKNLNTNTAGAVKRIAFQLEGRIKMNIQMKNIIDTGAYINSIEAEDMGATTWWVHDGVEYGIYQEFGTHKMAARPHWGPAIEATAKDVAKIIGAELFKTGGSWAGEGDWEAVIYK